jgi:hypothetical protein
MEARRRVGAASTPANCCQTLDIDSSAIVSAVIAAFTFAGVSIGNATAWVLDARSEEGTRYAQALRQPDVPVGESPIVCEAFAAAREAVQEGK